jgi:hypothetical protein
MVGILAAFNLVLVPGDQARRPGEQREAVRTTLAFDDAAAERTVVVDNVFGSVEVVGAAVSDVRVSGERVTRAADAEAEARARREVTLDMTQEGNRVALTVNGPFRCRDGSLSYNWEDRRYVVRYDLQVQVPERTDLVVKTVNDGDVVVRGVRGRLSLRNVNGRIEAKEVAGVVDAHTVNGAIHALFAESPSGESQFKTVNGDVRLSFGPGLSADFAMKTLNGELRSDFPVESLAPRPLEGRREGRRFVYRSDRFQNFRIGRGGPRVEMETLNGDVVVAAK